MNIGFNLHLALCWHCCVVVSDHPLHIKICRRLSSTSSDGRRCCHELLLQEVEASFKPQSTYLLVAARNYQTIVFRLLRAKAFAVTAMMYNCPASCLRMSGAAVHTTSRSCDIAKYIFPIQNCPNCGEHST